MLKVATWNVNSIRSRLALVLDWLKQNNIDILLLQELKCIDEQFPYEEFSDLGYNIYVLGQKSYNGVAILSKYPADEVNKVFPGDPCPDEARFIEIVARLPIGYTRIINLYVPNGGEDLQANKFKLKIQFLENMYTYLKSRDYGEQIIVGADWNVAPFDLDVYSPSEMQNVTCFSEEEKSIIRKIMNNGLIDPFRILHPNDKQYSWWDYRGGSFEKNLGLRIDYFLLTANCLKNISQCILDRTERSKGKASDHVPVLINFNA